MIIEIMPTYLSKISILGAGSWGLALSRLLANKGYSPFLWDIDQNALDCLTRTRKHPRLLPWVTLPPGVQIEFDLSTAIHNTHYILLVVPSHAIRGLLVQISQRLTKEMILVNCAKGLEPDSMKSMSQVFKEILPSLDLAQFTVLSGPSHAEEVSRDLPTTVTISGINPGNLVKVQELISTPRFRIYTNPDLMGVEMGGSLKNIIAIAAGACDGLGFGDNTKAALITRGLAEITRMGIQCGANPLTFAGLAGLGDLVVTCISQYSRNRKFGELIAQGLSPEKALSEIGMVVEGYKTTRAAYNLSQKMGIDMPIVVEVHAVLYEGKDPKKAVTDLMTRDLKSELVNIQESGKIN